MYTHTYTLIHTYTYIHNLKSLLQNNIHDLKLYNMEKYA